MKRILTALLLLVFAWLPAEAEVKESDWLAILTGKAVAAPVAADSKKSARPSLNITQPELQVKSPTYLLAPAPARKAKPVVRKRKKSVRRKPVTTRKARARARARRASRRKRDIARIAHDKKIVEEAWWQETGNPAVFVFRDCLNYHAERHRELAGPIPVGVQIAKAMDVNCRTEFDFMARTIVRQFGEEGFKKLAGELIETTFVPAAAVKQ